MATREWRNRGGVVIKKRARLHKTFELVNSNVVTLRPRAVEELIKVLLCMLLIPDLREKLSTVMLPSTSKGAPSTSGVDDANRETHGATASKEIEASGEARERIGEDTSIGSLVANVDQLTKTAGEVEAGQKQWEGASNTLEKAATSAPGRESAEPRTLKAGADKGTDEGGLGGAWRQSRKGKGITLNGVGPKGRGGDGGGGMRHAVHRRAHAVVFSPFCCSQALCPRGAGPISRRVVQNYMPKQYFRPPVWQTTALLTIAMIRDRSKRWRRGGKIKTWI